MITSVRTSFRCNLDDVMRQEIWPRVMPTCPQVGDIIQSARKYKGIKTTGGTHGQKVVEGERVVQLQVVRVTWVPETTMDGDEEYHEWYPVIELHLIPTQFNSITVWEEWYNRLVPA